MGTGFARYQQNALSSGIDGERLVQMTDQDLADAGVSSDLHRKQILSELDELLMQQTAGQCDMGPGAVAAMTANGCDDDGNGGSAGDDDDGSGDGGGDDHENDGAGTRKGEDTRQAQEAQDVRRTTRSSTLQSKAKLFLSYPRGDESTPFARSLKTLLEAGGFEVWLDDAIPAGSDFNAAIGEAIQASDGIVAIIDNKYATSVYCTNELAMGQSNMLVLFPLLFRDMTFDQLPAGMQYQLASVNCVPFPGARSDSARTNLLLEHIAAAFEGKQMHTARNAVSFDELRHRTWLKQSALLAAATAEADTAKAARSAAAASFAGAAAAASSAAQVGMSVLLRGSGARYAGGSFCAVVVDVRSTDDTIKVQYEDGGFKRFPRQEFEGLVPQRVLLRGHGSRYEGRTFCAIVIDVCDTDDTVKVQYEDGGFKRFSRKDYEAILVEGGRERLSQIEATRAKESMSLLRKVSRRLSRRFSYRMARVPLREEEDGNGCDKSGGGGMANNTGCLD